MQQLDFNKIRDYPITDVATMLGFKLTEKGDQLVGCCPVSQLMNPTAFKITPSKNRFICFCAECKKFPKQGGDCIEMVRRFRRVEHREAAAEIAKYFGAGKAADNAPPKQEVSPERKPTGFDPLVYLETLDTTHDELTILGISPQTLRDYKAGYSSKGLNRGRLAVAWCDVTGEIRAFIGVALKGESPEYLLPKGFTLPYFFGVDHVREGQLWVLPSVFDVLSSAENGETNVICPIAPTTADALTSLRALLLEKNCTLCF